MTRLLATVSAAAILAGVGGVGASAEPVFNRIASFPVSSNLPQGADRASATSSEIVAASEDGMTLVYSDSPLGVIGFIDIADPSAPKPAGVIATDGEPTSVAVAGSKAFAAVNTSESYTAPSGKLAVIDIAARKIEATCDLGGQPDALAVSPDRSLLAVAVENERDEDLNDGAIPQMPAGFVAIFKLNDGVPDCASKTVIDVTGLAEIAGDDPEPEFVDINAANQIAVTLQENNHIVVIDATSGTVSAHFSAGTVDLQGVDTMEEGALTFDGALSGLRREPDAIQWLDDTRLVTANEGDYGGGSRGFTIWNLDGSVAYDAGLTFEYAVAGVGHYPEARSGNKGVEPEGLEVATFGDTRYMFVLSERGSIAGVYRDTGAESDLVQLLPSGVGPEGAVAIPARNLFVTANETDLDNDGGARSHVMIYELAEATPAYPQIRSVMKDGRPLGWGALSGLAADPEKPGTLYAVNDSVYAAQPTIFTIDATKTPAEIVEARVVTRNGQPAQKLDLEGIVADGEGGFWLASEGRTDRLIPHAIYHVDAKGEITQEVAFPPELLAGEVRFGAEGITKVGDTLWIAIQREWADDEKGTVKLVAYNTRSKAWGAVRYPLDAAGEGWVGLSEITAHGDDVFIVERDNLIGDKALLKQLTRVKAAELIPGKLGTDLPVVSKEVVHDFIPDLKALGGYVVDKVEGFAVDAAGIGYVVTDNDGVDDSSGETYFFNIGKM